MVWFKADLRTDDHDGLIAAAKEATAQGKSLLPVYVVDPLLLHHLEFTPAGPEVLAGVLRELRAALRAAGSDLLVVTGAWEREVPHLAHEHGVTHVVAAQEVERMLLEPAERTAAALRAAGVGVTWYTGLLWPATSFNHNFRDWQARRPAPSRAQPAPPALPPLPAGVAVSEVPSARELRALLAASPPTHLHEESALRAEVAPHLAEAATGEEAQRQAKLIATGRDWLQRLTVYLAVGSGQRSSTGPTAGELEGVLADGIAAYESPAAQGASFPALFGTALALGALSRRRVYEAAQQAGAPASDPVKGAAITAESADFHWQLAQRNDMRPPDAPEGVDQHHWRWGGIMTDYAVAQPPSDAPQLSDGAPAILLLHGFGAFGDQWRSNMESLAQAGYTVYAPTLPGFGRSEKVAQRYSQVLWSNFLRDFVVQVVGRPVVLAGNSIGGFISTSMAADHPTLVKGLVLVNSAGPIQPSFDLNAWEQAAAKKRANPPPTWLVWAISRGLFWYLERSVPKTLEWLYPTAPERARGWLPQEISRASADAGAVGVFASVFYLPPPRPLNWLITQLYRGPVLVLQGVLDPLNDAAGRARELKALCGDQLEVHTLQAGHCPHDEVPQTFNEALQAWVGRVVLPRALAGGDKAATREAARGVVREGAGSVV